MCDQQQQQRSHKHTENTLCLSLCFAPDVSQIVANSNRELLAPTVEVAMACATAALAGKPRVAPECSVPALAISIAKGAKLQKGNLTNDIVALAQAYVLTGDALNTLETTTGEELLGRGAERKRCFASG